MTPVKAEGLKKYFGDVKALEDVNLKVEEGEIVGILGPNGAGKSTLIDILTGQTKPDDGEASVLGKDPVKESVKVREGLGILPEREDPPSFLTGREYLQYVSDIRGEEIDESRWVNRLGLEGKMEKQTRQLSKGERQKLMIIQAFFHDPDLVFIDEPLVNIDPFVQEEAKKIFREFRDGGGTVVMCTHVVSLAEEMCDRVLFLKDGEIQEEIKDVENLKSRLFPSK